MSCERIRAQLRDHASLDANGEAHLDECVECAAAAAESEGLSAEAGDVALSDFEGLFGEVEAAVQAERGPLARLRSASTPARVALALAIGLGVPVVVGLAVLRADIDVYPRARFAAIGGAFVAALATLAWSASRPLHRPPLSAAFTNLLIVAAVVAIAVAALLPAAHVLHPASLAGVGDDFASRALACFVFGAAVGVPVAFAARALGRGGPSWLGSPWMAPMAGAVAGNLALHLHCPLVARSHLLAGHATVLAPFVFAIALVVLRWRRASARAARRA